MIALDASIVLGDLLRIALEDVSTELDWPTQQRVAARMSELLDLADVELVRTDAPTRAV